MLRIYLFRAFRAIAIICAYQNIVIVDAKHTVAHQSEAAIQSYHQPESDHSLQHWWKCNGKWYWNDLFIFILICLFTKYAHRLAGHVTINIFCMHAAPDRREHGQHPYQLHAIIIDFDRRLMIQNDYIVNANYAVYGPRAHTRHTICDRIICDGT